MRVQTREATYIYERDCTPFGCQLKSMSWAGDAGARRPGARGAGRGDIAERERLILCYLSERAGNRERERERDSVI